MWLCNLFNTFKACSGKADILYLITNLIIMTDEIHKSINLNNELKNKSISFDKWNEEMNKLIKNQ